MTRTLEALKALSPQRAACLVDGSRPASQSELASLLRHVDPVALRDLLAEIADQHAFAWDAYSMLGRVGGDLALRGAVEQPAEPTIVWVLRSEVRDFFTETCAVLRSRKAAVELASGFGADTSKDPGDDANEVEFKGPGGDCVYTITRREVES